MARFLQPSIVRLFVSLCVSVFLALTAVVPQNPRRQGKRRGLAW